MIERKAAVAGIFYPASQKELISTLQELIEPIDNKRVVGAILPHAGYIYSGKIAGKTLSHIHVPERVVILCPNHTGYGEDVSLFPQGVWSFPGFKVSIDDEITRRLSSFEVFRLDTGAHHKEHSAEVIVPFLYYRNPNIKISVICIRTLQRSVLRNIALALADIYREYKDVLFVASSDMNHYEEDEISREKDSLAIEKIKKLDPDGFIEVCYTRNISVCGIGPIYALISFLREVNVKNAELVVYGNSADAGGDPVSVVGYAGIVFY